MYESDFSNQFSNNVTVVKIEKMRKKSKDQYALTNSLDSQKHESTHGHLLYGQKGSGKIL